MAKSYRAEELTNYLYSRLPQIYRDTDHDGVLRNFVECFVEGGMLPLLQDTMNIMDLIDVDKCPTQFLPQLCAMYGYEYTLELPELFQRRLLKYIIELYKRKGTKSVVNFIARELTGYDSELVENKDFTQEEIDVTGWTKEFKNHRNFILRLTAPFEDYSMYNKENIVIKLVEDFVPTNSLFRVMTSYWFKDEHSFRYSYGTENTTIRDNKEETKDYTNNVGFDTQLTMAQSIQQSVNLNGNVVTNDRWSLPKDEETASNLVDKVIYSIIGVIKQKHEYSIDLRQKLVYNGNEKISSKAEYSHDLLKDDINMDENRILNSHLLNGTLLLNSIVQTDKVTNTKTGISQLIFV